MGEIRAGFDGVCELCDETIGRGQSIVPKGSGWVHKTCWESGHE